MSFTLSVSNFSKSKSKTSVKAQAPAISVAMSVHAFSALHYVFQSTDKILPRNRFILLSSNEKLSSLMKQSTSSGFALNIQSFTCSEVQELLVNPEGTHWNTVTAKEFSPVCDGMVWRLGTFRVKSPSACIPNLSHTQVRVMICEQVRDSEKNVRATKCSVFKEELAMWPDLAWNVLLAVVRIFRTSQGSRKGPHPFPARPFPKLFADSSCLLY